MYLIRKRFLSLPQNNLFMLILKQYLNRSATIVCLEDCYFGTLSLKKYQQIQGKQEKAKMMKKREFIGSTMRQNEVLPIERMSKLSSCFYKRKYQAGEIIFREGDIVEHIYLIRKGEVELQKEADVNLGENEKFKAIIRVAKLTSKEYFGDCDIFYKRNRFYTAIVTSARATIYYCNVNLFLRCVEEAKEFWDEFGMRIEMKTQHRKLVIEDAKLTRNFIKNLKQFSRTKPENLISNEQQQKETKIKEELSLEQADLMEIPLMTKSSLYSSRGSSQRKYNFNHLQGSIFIPSQKNIQSSVIPNGYDVKSTLTGQTATPMNSSVQGQHSKTSSLFAKCSSIYQNQSQNILGNAPPQNIIYNQKSVNQLNPHLIEPFQIIGNQEYISPIHQQQDNEVDSNEKKNKVKEVPRSVSSSNLSQDSRLELFDNTELNWSRLRGTFYDQPCQQVDNQQLVKAVREEKDELREELRGFREQLFPSTERLRRLQSNIKTNSKLLKDVETRKGKKLNSIYDEFVHMREVCGLKDVAFQREKHIQENKEKALRLDLQVGSTKKSHSTKKISDIQLLFHKLSNMDSSSAFQDSQRNQPDLLVLTSLTSRKETPFIQNRLTFTTPQSTSVSQQLHQHPKHYTQASTQICFDDRMVENKPRIKRLETKSKFTSFKNLMLYNHMQKPILMPLY